MLPQIFRVDDPLLKVTLPTERRVALEGMLAELPPTVFTADDSLGWVYQFWQRDAKDAANDGVKSGAKIDADTLPAVTQLFTEHYMVLFLLHNTIGAWWAAKQISAWPQGKLDKYGSEAELRAAVALPGYTFDYLRFVKDEASIGKGVGQWRPAAGAFPGWPRSAKELTVLDPSCGSGHFLVSVLELLARLRIAEEGLSAADAVNAVLKENLFGLELDQRCTQIAAFNVALAAWKLAGGKHIPLPDLHLACSGMGPNCTEDQWVKLAETCMSPGRRSASPTHALLPTHGREAIRSTLRDMHALFSKAPELGSLIDPTATAGTLGSADWETVKPFLADVMAEEASTKAGATGGDSESYERAVAAQGMAKAAEILAGEYTLVITNVPYLGRGGQGDVIKAFCEKEYPEAKSDLATVFVARMLKWVGRDEKSGTIAAVTPQNWLFLTSYKKLRERLLKERTWNIVVRMGEHAFESSAAAGAFAAMMILSGGKPAKEPPHVMAGIDVSAPRGQQPIYAAEKAALLRGEGTGSAAEGEDSAALQMDGNPFHAAGNALQAGGNTLRATRSTLQPDRSTLQTRGSALQADGRSLQLDGRPLPTTRRPADFVNGGPGTAHGAPARDAGGQSAAHGAQRPADGAPAMAPLPADSPESDEGPEDQTPADPAADAGPADGSIKLVPQAEQLKNPDATILLSQSSGLPLLKDVCHTYQGIGTADAGFYIMKFWEVPSVASPWSLYQMAPESLAVVSGCHSVLRWEDGDGILCSSPQARVCGQPAWGKDGIAIAVTAGLPRGLFMTSLFDCTLAALIPDKREYLQSLCAFVLDVRFASEVRKVDQALSVTESSFGKVPFDLAHWQKVAAEKYPNGLPEPQSDDPTQWLFHGHPAARLPLDPAPTAHHPTTLKVAVARLVGYRWPAELDTTMRLAPEARAWVEKCKELERFADDDGVVPLVPMRGEPAAEGRVRDLLRAAFGSEWSGTKEPALLDAAAAANGAKSPAPNLDDWLKNRFFAEHCALFHNRPFVWHIWDGRKKDGFGVLVHYHRLAAPNGEGRRLLEKITHGYLGDWIARQRDEIKANKAGADARLAAALDLQKKLEAILAGEPPFDIFVRWKPLHEQPIGWEPDINDGVRMNIRPFVEGGVLREKVNVKWKTDRGQEPQKLRPKADFPWFWDGATFVGDRVNDIHLTNAAKQRARDAKGKA
jgi:hypothetical protein